MINLFLKKKKRVLAALCTATMMVAALPVGAFAVTDDSDEAKRAEYERLLSAEAEGNCEALDAVSETLEFEEVEEENIIRDASGLSANDAIDIPINQACGIHWNTENRYRTTYVRFSIPTNGIVTITYDNPLTANGTYGAHELEVYDASQNKIGWLNYFYNKGQYCTMKMGLPAGTYYLSFYPTYSLYKQGGAVNMSFIVKHSPSSSCELEKNDTIDTANVFALNRQYRYFWGSSSKDDADCFKFNLRAGAPARLLMSTDFVNLVKTTSLVYLYDPNGEKVDYQLTSKYANVRYDSKLDRYVYDFTPTKNGYYCLMIDNYTGNLGQFDSTVEMRQGTDLNAPVVDEKSEIRKFVGRLYNILLDRNAEPQGLNDWTDKLFDGTAMAAEIVQGIANSPEFINKHLSNPDMVERMYQSMLGRNSDAEGKADWVQKCNNGMSVNAIINGFSGSAEFGNLCSQYGISAGSINLSEARDKNEGVTGFVARCYTKALGRDFDVNGLNSWCNTILSAPNQRQAALDMASNGFFHSQEFANKNTSNEQYVDILYRTFLGREADPSGRADWVGKLNSGVSRDDVMAGFSGSAEFDAIMRSYKL